MKPDYAIVAVLFVLACFAVPAQAATRIYPTYEWQTWASTEQQPLANAFDGNLATYAQWGTSYNQGMIKLTFPAGTNLTEMRYYEKDHADTHYLVTEANWTYDPAKLVSGGGGTTYNTWANVSINSGNGYITSSPLYYRGGSWWLETAELEFYGNPAPLGGINFTCAPTNGTVPFTTVCTDLSEGAIISYGWQGTGPGSLYWDAANASSSSLFIPTEPGNYSITHSIFNGTASMSMTRTDYIQVTNATATTTLYVTAINALNAYPIHGAQVNLYDVENTSWSNTTTTAGTGSIISYSDHHVNAYVSASGFADNEKLSIPVSNVYDSVLMFPQNTTNVTAGNVTLFVSVFDGTDHSKPIVGAGVTVITASSAQGQFTNSGGMAQFAVPNKTTVLVDAEAVGQGYNGATQSVYTGTGSGASASVTATIYLSKKSVTPTVTATTLPGGGTPTPTITILPGCEDPMSPECQASQNEYSMGWLSQNGLMLIQFFVICFIIFMAKGMGR